MTPDEILDHTPVTFGKYKTRGLTPDQISNEEPGYVVWMYENRKPTPCSKALYDACCQDVNDEDVGRDQEY